ncbi:MAG: GGDEF domain-containing protein [Firmicutes bacterium]|nr:GGDEF domain-containing protein [Bacillota bacterium]
MTEHRRYETEAPQPAASPWPRIQRWVNCTVAGYLGLLALLSWWILDMVSKTQAEEVVYPLILTVILTVAFLIALRIIVHRGLVLPLQDQADHDDMTGLCRPGPFWVRAERQLRDAVTTHHPLALIFFDLDDFKQLNDSNGHVIGDAVLRAVGRLMQTQARQDDTVGRLGGEEFGWVMPCATVDEAVSAAHRLLNACRTCTIEGVVGVTFSAGVAGYHGIESDPPSTWDLARWADRALYRAKAAGKDRVLAAEPRDVSETP